jgi:hypothetical protein
MVPFNIATGDFPSAPPPRGRVRSFTATRVLNPTTSCSALAQLDDSCLLTGMVLSECLFDDCLDIFQFMQVRQDGWPI